jgi:hypothetical protein
VPSTTLTARAETEERPGSGGGTVSVDLYSNTGPVKGARCADMRMSLR